jgi:aconitate hydratase
MGKGVAQKIIENHLISGKPIQGNEVGIKIDQTLTQDATGTMAYLEFEAMGISKIKTELSASYVDHNMLQEGFENADDHHFLQSVAAKYGIYFSRPGNGICHQVHLERFSSPAKTLLGSDSHTPTSGGAGMLSIGAGGIDVAVAMAGGPFYFIYPEIININLTGKLQPFVSAKDIILEVLRRFTVKGGVNRIFEYTGEGVKCLSVPERSTITNMGAELGATTSIFQSDEITLDYLKKQRREEKYKELLPDRDAQYDKIETIDLNKLEPVIAQPHSPDNVCKVSELSHIKVNQVIIGSCTNSSYRDLYVAAKLIQGKTVHSGVSMAITPGSKQVYEMAAQDGLLTEFIKAGARILESACGPCIGMGLAPGTDNVSVRTFNRNFQGRSGTMSAKVYLSSPEVAVACAITGQITDPRKVFTPIEIRIPKEFFVNDNMIIPPLDESEAKKIEVTRGPNIQPLPQVQALNDKFTGKILIKVGDNISTDHILPAGAKILPLRSNIPKISEYVFSNVDKEFVNRAKKEGGGFIVGGSNYGQGSSREHAAIAPMYLKIKGVIVKSFARIHKANLVNFGILPLVFKNEKDYDQINLLDAIEIDNVKEKLGKRDKSINTKINGKQIELLLDITDERSFNILIAGGLLNYTKKNQTN